MLKVHVSTHHWHDEDGGFAAHATVTVSGTLPDGSKHKNRYVFEDYVQTEERAKKRNDALLGGIKTPSPTKRTPTTAEWEVADLAELTVLQHAFVDSLFNLASVFAQAN